MFTAIELKNLKFPTLKLNFNDLTFFNQQSRQVSLIIYTKSYTIEI